MPVNGVHETIAALDDIYTMGPNTMVHTMEDDIAPPRNSVMNQEREEDFEATAVTPLALVRLEIRYMRRDFQDLKTTVTEGLKANREELKEGLDGKANRTEYAAISDHEERLRKLEGTRYWLAGAGAMIGGLIGLAVHIIWK